MGVAPWDLPEEEEEHKTQTEYALPKFRGAEGHRGAALKWPASKTES